MVQHLTAQEPCTVCQSGVMVYSEETPNECLCCYVVAGCLNKLLFANMFAISTDKVMVCLCYVHNLLNSVSMDSF